MLRDNDPLRFLREVSESEAAILEQDRKKLEQEHPDIYDLFVRFGACEKSLLFLPDELRQRYESLRTDVVNVMDDMRTNGRGVYVTFVESVERGMRKRESLAETLADRMRSIGSEALCDYADLMQHDLIQREDDDISGSVVAENRYNFERSRFEFASDLRYDDLMLLGRELQAFDMAKIEVWRREQGALQRQREADRKKRRSAELRKKYDRYGYYEMEAINLIAERLKLSRYDFTNGKQLGTLSFEEWEKLDEWYDRLREGLDGYGIHDMYTDMENIKSVLDDILPASD